MQRRDSNSQGRPFWSHPLGWPHAVVLSGAMLIVGVLIGLVSGVAAVPALKWPFNVWTLAVVAVVPSTIMLMFGRRPFFVWFSGVPVFISSIAALSVVSLVMAVFPSDLTRSWPFVLSLLLLIMNMVACFVRNTILKRRFDLRFILSHLGMLIIIFCMTFGAGDRIKAKMHLAKDARTSVAVTDDAYHFRTPFSLTLKEFSIAGSEEKPVYRSVIDVENGAVQTNAVIEVNRPLKTGDWLLYQYSHAGDASIIEAVYDPWLAPTYAGIYMLLAGAVMMLWRRRTI